MATDGTVENFARGYQDYLQAPLQVCFAVLRYTDPLLMRTRTAACSP
jgi:hypothetical protein